MPTRLLAVAAMVLTLAAAGCSSASAARPAAAGTPSAHAGSADARAACGKRKAGPQIYVRDAEPGTAAVGSELGGEWTWDYATSQCLDTLENITATAGTAPGECTTAGWVSDNPGYDYNAVPAPPIPDPVTEAGPGCGS